MKKICSNAYMMPDPDRDGAEALYICKHHDSRMINGIGGAVWNFPCSKKGKISIELKIIEKQARFSFADRWYNTCDPYVTYQAPFWFELDAKDIGEKFAKLDFEYDTEKGIAALYINGDLYFKVNMTTVCPTGLSYIIMQCDTDGDSEGFYVRSVSKE